MSRRSRSWKKDEGVVSRLLQSIGVKKSSDSRRRVSSLIDVSSEEVYVSPQSRAAYFEDIDTLLLSSPPPPPPTTTTTTTTRGDVGWTAPGVKKKKKKKVAKKLEFPSPPPKITVDVELPPPVDNSESRRRRVMQHAESVAQDSAKSSFAMEEAQKRLLNEMEDALQRCDPPSIASSSILFGAGRNYNWLLVPFFYFVLGAFLATPNLAIKYFAIRVLDINPSSFGLLSGIIATPWYCKPVFGLVSDTRPLFNRHRTPYLVVCSLLGFAVWVALSIPGAHSRTALGFGTLMLASNVFICFCDVIVDCLVARAAREEMDTHKGRSQSIVWFMRHAGSLVGTVVGAYLVANVASLHCVFAVTSSLPLVLLVGSVILHEPHKQREEYYDEEKKVVRYTTPQSSHGNNSSILEKVAFSANKIRGNRVLVNLCKFIFLFAATPNSGLTFTYFLINDLAFSEEFMGLLSIAATVAAMAGLATYSLFFKKFKTRLLTKISIWTGTALAIMPVILVTRLNRTVFHINDRWFALSDDVAEGFASQLSMMPILVIIARVCPHGCEGMIYAGFMSVSNFGGAVSTWGGAALTHVLGITKADYSNLWLLVVLCTVTNFIPLFFVHWLPDEDELDRMDEEAKHSDAGACSGSSSSSTNTSTMLVMDTEEAMEEHPLPLVQQTRVL